MKRALVSALLLGLLTAMPVAAQPSSQCFDQDTNDLRTTDGDDFLTGSNGVDIVALGIGDDQYFASGGNDLVCGEAGVDVIAGEDDDDRLSGGSGPDTVLGLGGGDVISGGNGEDDIRGGAGSDVLRTGPDGARDLISDGFGEDVIVGFEEDVWYRCEDEQPDDHDNFLGITAPDPDCTT